MKKWNIEKTFSPKLPNEVLKVYADSLNQDSEGALSGSVVQNISFDSEDRPRLFYSLHVVINALKQPYRLFEIEQTTEDAYPVNLKVTLLTGSLTVNKIDSPESLDTNIANLIDNPMVKNLMTHFMHLSELKAASK